MVNIFSYSGKLYAHLVSNAVPGVSKTEGWLATLAGGIQKRVCGVPFGIEAHGMAEDGRIFGRVKFGGGRQPFVLVHAEQ